MHQPDTYYRCLSHYDQLMSFAKIRLNPHLTAVSEHKHGMLKFKLPCVVNKSEMTSYRRVTELCL